MIKEKMIKFSSKADGTDPLYAQAFWDNAGKELPIVAVMYGYNGDMEAILPVCRRLADKGLCAVGINMRGRGSSAGRSDSGAVEIHDIMDGIDAASEILGNLVDRTRCSILGYSGGGGNVLSAVTKFPDRFQVGVSFFGISDYECFYRDSIREDCRVRMEDWIGCSPDQDRMPYLARNSSLAAANCRNTEIHLFWDEEENQCPGKMNEQFAGIARAAGNENVILHMSRKGDEYRWIHGYPEGQPSLIKAEDIFMPRMRERCEDLSLPRAGRLTAAGYVVTRHFSFWLGNGRSGLTEIKYELGPPPSVISQASVYDDPAHPRSR